MPVRKTLTITTTAIALALAAAPMAALTALPATAQDATTQDAQESSAFSAQQLDAFATALIEVSGVRQKYNPLLQSAETEEQQAAIIEEANAEMTQAIEDTDGMTMDSYLEIAQAASQDQALNDRIVARLQDLAASDQ